MVWPGFTAALFVGAILVFAVDGDLGPVDADAVGVIAMVLGAALLVLGILRLNHGRRRDAGAPLPLTGHRDRIYRTGKGKTFAMITAVVYILSPIDIVPDIFLPVGIIDDATAFSWLLFAIGQEISRKRRKAL
ncbi:YkvA family protein [Actinomadura alba]|uniref:YkvA family protein n=1 Tax=Actinomadura alba TaxID=406431 RepID=UPI0031D20835